MSVDQKTPIPFDAVKAIVEALQPLEPTLRKRALTSAVALLGDETLQSALGALPPGAMHAPSLRGGKPALGTPSAEPARDIRSLKDEKNPASKTEMAALVAYYLAEVAEPPEQKDTIAAADLEKYFKQAKYPRPHSDSMTLVHAKNAGYLDALGSGVYRLNPVGYNLVVHNLPRSESASGPSTPKRKAKPRPKAKRRAKGVRRTKK